MMKSKSARPSCLCCCVVASVIVFLLPGKSEGGAHRSRGRLSTCVCPAHTLYYLKSGSPPRAIWRNSEIATSGEAMPPAKFAPDLDLPLILDRASATPLQQQLREHLRQAMLDGRLAS